MTSFFDTPVLVAAFWGDHPQHDACLRLLSSAKPPDAACSAHSLAELYAVMTRLPVKPPVPPEQAMLFVNEVRARLTIVPLAEAGYAAALEEASGRNVAGGAIYDALILQCARQADAVTIYTLNLDHFRRLAPDLADRLVAP